MEELPKEAAETAKTKEEQSPGDYHFPLGLDGAEIDSPSSRNAFKLAHKVFCTFRLSGKYLYKQQARHSNITFNNISSYLLIYF